MYLDGDWSKVQWHFNLKTCDFQGAEGAETAYAIMYAGFKDGKFLAYFSLCSDYRVEHGLKYLE